MLKKNINKMNDSKKGQVQGIGLLVLFIIVIYIINSYQQNNVITITNSELNMDIIKINSNENLTIINKDLTPYRITIDGKNFQVNPTIP